MPADVAYVSTLRLTAASLAARCDLTIDDIEDLRLAVDEACALLLPHAAADSHARRPLRAAPRAGSRSTTIGARPTTPPSPTAAASPGPCWRAGHRRSTSRKDGRSADHLGHQGARGSGPVTGSRGPIATERAHGRASCSPELH